MAKKDNNKIIRRRLANAYLSSVISISLVLFLIGTASIIILNSGSVSKYLKENMKISVILRQNASEEEAASYIKSIETLPYVKETQLITREQGKAELEALLGEDFLSIFETSPIPLSVDVKLKAEYVAKDSLVFVTKHLSKSDLVDEIDNRGNLVEILNDNLAKLSMIFGAFIALLLFISYVLIANMVRLSVFARRFTIHTMKLVGATKAFIRKPFIASAVIQGLISATIASFGVWGICVAARKSFEELFVIFDKLSLLYSVGIVIVAGVCICVISTYFVVGKLVSAPKDELYY